MPPRVSRARMHTMRAHMRVNKVRRTLLTRAIIANTAESEMSVVCSLACESCHAMSWPS
jgi:hypothetical protein